MRLHFALSITAALVACGPKVLRSPSATPDISAWAKWDPTTETGQRPVTVGTPLSFMVDWHGWCQHDGSAPRITAGGNDEYPCEFVDHVVKVTCANDACTVRPTDSSYAYEIIPTKAGELHATVTVTKKGGSTSKQFQLEPVSIVIPNAVTSECHEAFDGGWA